ncbi:endogenous retrovirus group K member 19 Rec protein-like isoform X2 [Trachypithecus francoisi]|uniref:endogenous retrovirus group K member 19 Rec protein-like isoform X2 n=1 Tax=Trachypithecus francoisi TaxID=54180 RepID=UPI00141B20D1|nr:endogenous retrovirus group K member 19 Rec protein-like isoform X2 [Trachypithecus francoisi]
MVKRSQSKEFLKKFQELNLSTQRTFTFGTRRAEPPAWGQLKKLTQEAEGVVQQAGQPKTPLTLFLAMLAIVNCRSAGDGAKGQTPNPSEPNM